MDTRDYGNIPAEITSEEKKKLGSALRTAAIEGDTDRANALLAAGADVNSREMNRYTALILAASYEHMEMVRLLLQQGADINAQSKNGNTALSLAAAQGNLEMVTLLCDQGADFRANVRNHNGIAALARAASQRHVEIVDVLCGRGADFQELYFGGSGLLSQVIAPGNFEVVKFLLERGCPPNIPWEWHQTEEDEEIWVDPPLIAAVYSGEKQMVLLLLEYGADVNGSTENGKTALMEAVSGSDLDMVTLLIEQGADVNAESDRRVTALLIANNNQDRALEAKDAAAIARAEAIIDLLYSVGAKD